MSFRRLPRPRETRSPAAHDPGRVTTSHCCAVDREFDDRIARKELRRYLKRGPATPTREMLELLAPLVPPKASLLDIGGGIGTIHHELLERGARSAMQIDASSSYLAVSTAEAARRGHGDRVVFRHADVRDVADSVEPADVVTLDRVVCCDPDYRSLLGIAAARTRSVFAFSYPRPMLATRVIIGAINVMRRLRRLPFRAYVHSPAAMIAVLEQAGLRRAASAKRWLWAVEVFQRSG